MKAGSFFPGVHYTSLYAMAGDDCSLFYELDQLTEKQRQDHRANQELTAMLQVALCGIGHGGDHLALYEEFQQPGWRETLARYHDFFARMLDAVVPLANFSYHPREGFYESVADYIGRHPNLTDVVNFYMASGSNSPIHQNPQLLEINRRVNSKRHFAENAPAYGIPFPDTLVTTKAAIESDAAAVVGFLEKHGHELMIKLEGLAGARNVAVVRSLDQCREYIAEYDGDMVVLLQQRLDLDFYREMTVDLVVSPEAIRIANTRKILFADGLWVGNLMGGSVSVTAAQAAQLIRVGEYARHHGYVSDEGSNCGIDFFVGQDGSLIVTEINARWTGGLFPAEILRQLGVTGRDAIPFFDVVPLAQREAYVDFMGRYLIGEFEGPFNTVPLGFGCFTVPMDGTDCFYTWQMVVGDFNAFARAKNAELGATALPTADIIAV